VQAVGLDEDDQAAWRDVRAALADGAALVDMATAVFSTPATANGSLPLRSTHHLGNHHPRDPPNRSLEKSAGRVIPAPTAYRAPSNAARPTSPPASVVGCCF
jgi:hypothetical protein